MYDGAQTQTSESRVNTQTNELDNFTRILQEFQTLHMDVPQPRPTFIEISEFPHYETVWSNILKFFLDPSGPHRMGNAVLTALVEGHDPSVSYEIEREVDTKGGGRLDLLISSATELIAIENKVFSEVKNPFREYARYLEENASGRTVRKLLLVLRRPPILPTHGFEVVTYEGFLRRIGKELESRTPQADPHYLLFLRDFIETVERIDRGWVNMTPGQMKFFAQKQEAIDDLLGTIVNVRKEFKARCLLLVEALEIEHLDNIKAGVWNRENWLAHTLTFAANRKGKHQITLEVSLSATGWLVQFILPGAKTNVSRLRELLESAGVVYQEPEEEQPLKLTHCEFAYNTPIADIAAVVQPLLEKLAASNK